jgi:hypothetical protein
VACPLLVKADVKVLDAGSWFVHIAAMVSCRYLTPKGPIGFSLEYVC